MNISRQRAAVWGIWGLVSLLALLDVAFWMRGGAPLTAAVLALRITRWAVILLLTVLATRKLGRLGETIARMEDAHRATQHEVAQLQMHNAMLEILAKSVDVPLAFQSLAKRIAQLVPCDRVGLALLTESNEFQTYTARVAEEERRARPRPEVVFKADQTAIGTVVRTREPLIVNDTARAAPDFLDINVLHTSGFGSALLLPLVTKGHAVGTLNVVSRQKGAFADPHVQALLPVTEIFAVAYVAQQLQLAVTRQRTMETMTELTLGVANEINGALQAIIGHCDLLERMYPDPNLQRDLALVVRQAQRISTLLDRMRTASNERLNEAAATVKQGIPSSPEGFGEQL